MGVNEILGLSPAIFDWPERMNRCLSAALEESMQRKVKIAVMEKCFIGVLVGIYFLEEVSGVLRVNEQ